MSEFFFVIAKKGLFFLTSRRNEMTKTVKAIDIANIKPIMKNSKGVY